MYEYYVVGKDVIDWLISWSFASDRSSAADLATEMLRNGFFHTINLDPTTNTLALSKDGVLSRDVMDSNDARYMFVSERCLGFKSKCPITERVHFTFSMLQSMHTKF